jgi:hypothetical protein
MILTIGKAKDNRIRYPIILINGHWISTEQVEAKWKAGTIQFQGLIIRPHEKRIRKSRLIFPTILDLYLSPSPRDQERRKMDAGDEISERNERIRNFFSKNVCIEHNATSWEHHMHVNVVNQAALTDV